jgi:hypothetical protein
MAERESSAIQGTSTIEGMNTPNNADRSGAHVVVIGGAGFLGSRAVRVLRGRGDVRVSVAGRHGPDLIVDLQRVETFAALKGAAVVVNASSSHGAAPDELAAFCLREGLILLECSSDRLVVERLLALRSSSSGARGAVILGAGIFTGLSNTLGAAALSALPSATSLELGVRSSPFSGAGQGTIDLVVDALREDARVVVDGEARLARAALSGPTLPFPKGPRRTLTFSWPEVSMLSASSKEANPTKALSVSMSFAPAPSPLWATFRTLPGWLLRSGPFRRFLGLYFRVLRRGLLKNVASEVQIVAVARDAAGSSVVVGFVADDGFDAAGVAAAAAALIAAERKPTGVRTIDEVMGARELLAKMKELAPATSMTTTGL